MTRLLAKKGERDPLAVLTERVGQHDIEEIDVVVGGGNYGWPIKEGSACFDQNGADLGFAFAADTCPGEPAAELIDPIAEYGHDEGIAVVGGFLSR